MKVARHFSAGIGHWLTGRVPLGTTDWWHPNQPSLRDSMSHLGKFPALKCRASFIPSLTGRAECLAPILGASSNHPLCGWQLIGWEIPRLCRAGSKSLTDPGMLRRNPKMLARSAPGGSGSVSGSQSKSGSENLQRYRIRLRPRLRPRFRRCCSSRYERLKC